MTTPGRAVWMVIDSLFAWRSAYSCYRLAGACSAAGWPQENKRHSRPLLREKSLQSRRSLQRKRRLNRLRHPCLDLHLDLLGRNPRSTCGKQGRRGHENPGRVADGMQRFRFVEHDYLLANGLPATFRAGPVIWDSAGPTRCPGAATSFRLSGDAECHGDHGFRRTRAA